MTGRERFMTALRRQEPDRVPVWELIVDPPTLTAGGARDMHEFADQEDLDGVTVFEDSTRAPLSASAAQSFRMRGDQPVTAGTRLERDDWGIVWATPAGGPAYPVAGPLATAADVRRFRPPDPDDPTRLRTLRVAVDRFKGKRAVVFCCHDAFEWPHYLRGGMEPLFEDWMEEPLLALELAAMASDWKMRLMRNAIKAGADAVVSGDDYAAGVGPVMSPAHFRRFIVPFLKRTVDAAHALNVPFIKHTDGNLWPILDDLVGTGIDALDPIEPKADMDIGAVKAKYGTRIALVGNLDVSALLPRATPEEVEEAVKETIAKAAPGGGYILASSNTIHPGVKPENYHAMAQAARRWGNYPLDPKFVREFRDRDYMVRWRSVV